MFNKTDNKREKLDKLYNLRVWLESSPESRDFIVIWKKYESLSPQEKQTLKNKWDNYFENVRKTLAYERYHYMTDVFRRAHIDKDGIDEIKQLAQEAKTQVEESGFELQKPELEDPVYISSNYYVAKYKQTLSEIEDVKKELEYEGKSDKEVAEDISRLLQ